MYHEEKVIDGVLCWRGTPNGKWTPYTLEAMTTALKAMRASNDSNRNALLEATEKLNSIRAAVG